MNFQKVYKDKRLKKEDMPTINDYKCNKCDLCLNTGWGSYMFAEDDNGKKVICRHPFEESAARKILGIKGIFKKLNKKTAKDRIGIMRHCICMDCASLLELEIQVGEPDLRDDNSSYIRKPRDKRKCHKCGSEKVVTVLEAVGQVCPKCKKGYIVEEDTGAVS